MGKGVASLAQQYCQVSSAAGHSKAWDSRAYTVQPFHIVEDHCLYFSNARVYTKAKFSTSVAYIVWHNEAA